MLLNRAIVALLTAEAVSSLGSQMTFLALPWFVLVTTGSADEDEHRSGGRAAARGAVGIPSGALVSRLGARMTMVIGDGARAPLMLAIPLLH